MGLASVRALRGKNMRLGGGDDELTALFVVHYTGAVFRNKCALWWCSFLFLSFFLVYARLANCFVFSVRAASFRHRAGSSCEAG